MILYAESSAVLSWLLGEPGQDRVVAQLQSADRVATSAITVIECARGLARARHDGRITPVEERAALHVLDEAAGSWHLLEVSADVIDRARAFSGRTGSESRRHPPGQRMVDPGGGRQCHRAFTGRSRASQCARDGNAGRAVEMLLGEILIVAFASLRANIMRSILTMLGIVIGVGSVVVMVALGTGAQNAIKDKIGRLGTTILQIDPQRVQQNGVASATSAKLTMKDVIAIRDASPHVIGVNQTQDRSLQVTWTNRNTNVQVTGTGANFLEVRGFHLDIGRMFTEEDERARRRVAVLGATVLPLLGLSSPSQIIGENIRIGSRSFTVIGVMAERGVAGVGDGDQQIPVPYSVGQFELFGSDRLGDIWVRAASEAALDDAMYEATMALRRSHRLRTEQPSDFRVRNQADFLSVLGETTQTMTLLLAGVAGVSLLVGGIGIMNIMLVSVTERTREIGIRKAVGATRGNILLQFMIEAIVLCMAGGAIGVGLGITGSLVMSQSFGWDSTVNLGSIAMAFGFAATVGVLFGVWPAKRASALDPIVALRYE